MARAPSRALTRSGTTSRSPAIHLAPVKTPPAEVHTSAATSGPAVELARPLTETRATFPAGAPDVAFMRAKTTPTAGGAPSSVSFLPSSFRKAPALPGTLPGTSPTAGTATASAAATAAALAAQASGGGGGGGASASGDGGGEGDGGEDDSAPASQPAPATIPPPAPSAPASTPNLPTAGGPVVTSIAVQRPGFPWKRVAIGVAVVAGLAAVVWWLFFREED